MRYDKALEIGQARAEEAADLIRRWTGIKVYALCAVNEVVSRRNPEKDVGWEPVGQRSWKEIIGRRGDLLIRGLSCVAGRSDNHNGTGTEWQASCSTTSPRALSCLCLISLRNNHLHSLAESITLPNEV